MMEEPIVASLELGGTKCIAAVSLGTDVLRMTALPTGDEPHIVLATLLDLLAQWRGNHPFVAIGVASFGPIALDPADPEFGRILQTPKPGWSGFDVRGAVSARFDLPLAIDTDVAGAALAEGRWGAARGCATHCYLTIGTGIGLGLVTDGRVHHGTLHPEAGHLPVRRVAGDGFAGICPFHGDCLEGLASGPAIAARTGRAGPDIADDDPVWSLVAREVADLMTTLILVVAPHRIVVGGGVASQRPGLLEAIRAATVQRMGHYLPGCDEAGMARLIVPPALAHAGPLGASALALDALGHAAA
ncbi:ROK family protein [Croceibacterium sp. TMG7-5b_MA50]|uniref:ROK family protein n=1 Tax=Croceibacterium sp. TMG7-5b_MA50 TaxID=3121290 RepID=UPI00322154B9